VSTAPTLSPATSPTLSPATAYRAEAVARAERALTASTDRYMHLAAHALALAAVRELRGDAGRVAGCDVLLLVGCGSTSAPCAPLLDVSVWLDLDEGERRRRVTRREGDPGAWWRAWGRQEGLLLAERDSARLADVRIAPTARRTASASASAADEKAPVGHPVTGAQSDRPPRLSADG